VRYAKHNGKKWEWIELGNINRAIRKVPMKIITIAIPQDYYDLMKKLVIYGLTPSISEYTRVGINDKLSRDVELIKSILEQKIEVPAYNPNIIKFDNRTFTVKSHADFLKQMELN